MELIEYLIKEMRELELSLLKLLIEYENHSTSNLIAFYDVDLSFKIDSVIKNANQVLKDRNNVVSYIFENIKTKVAELKEKGSKSPELTKSFVDLDNKVYELGKSIHYFSQ